MEEILVREETHDWMIDALSRERKGFLLDAPAGTGSLPSRLKKMGFSVSCCDINPSLFLAQDIEIKRGDLSQSLPYPSGSFDFITCIEGLEHLENPFNAIREFHRILKPGGKLFLSLPNYLNIRMPALENLYRAHPHFQLQIVCDQFLRSARLPVIKKRWSSGEEQSDLKSFDIGVMPLSDDLWSRGKCRLKIVQYFRVGLPVVCTPVGVNSDIIRDGENGFWATNHQEWIDRLSTLIQNPDLRYQMGL